MPMNLFFGSTEVPSYIAEAVQLFHSLLDMTLVEVIELLL